MSQKKKTLLAPLVMTVVIGNLLLVSQNMASPESDGGAQETAIDPQIRKEGEKRGRVRVPKDWTKLEWEAKRKILFGFYAPSDIEKRLVREAMPQSKQAKSRELPKVLVFYRCRYPHASIATGTYAFQEMGKVTGDFEAVISDDPAIFTEESLSQYSVVLLNNTTDWDVTVGEAGVAALIKFVKNGGGLVGIHAASDACKKNAEGAAMMGGVFSCHPWLPKGTWAFKLEQASHPLNAAFSQKGFWMRDEVYLYQNNTFSRERSSVLVSLDMGKKHNCSSPNLHKNQKVKDLAVEGGDYPVAWLQTLGKGRVFYSNFGHNNMTYWQPQILKHYLDGIRYALGDVDAEAVPSAKLTELDVALAPDK